MDKLEKALNGLQCCNTWSCAGLYEGYQPDYDACIECPFRCDPIDPEECHKKLLDSAISLLKAQEPRMMTLEEVQKISTEDLDGVVWLESRMHCDPDNGDCDIWFSGYANPVEACETDIHIYAFGNEVPVEAKKRMYGTTWRCWTARPTDEQREAAPWTS